MKDLKYIQACRRQKLASYLTDLDEKKANVVLQEVQTEQLREALQAARAEARSKGYARPVVSGLLGTGIGGLTAGGLAKLLGSKHYKKWAIGGALTGGLLLGVPDWVESAPHRRRSKLLTKALEATPPQGN